ncbi:MAG: hypothetical protein ABSG59_14130 [Verrucomicrobiota bacterium]|jgi:hypothetical protein
MNASITSPFPSMPSSVSDQPFLTVFAANPKKPSKKGLASPIIMWDIDPCRFAL